MPNRLALAVANDIAQSIQLSDGIAEVMGDGIFIVFQTNQDGEVQQVVLAEDDLRRLLDRP